LPGRIRKTAKVNGREIANSLVHALSIGANIVDNAIQLAELRQ
jgi:hypothetical protein